MQNSECGDFPVLATDKHTGKQRKSRAGCRAGLLPWSSVEDNVVWHAVLVWTALTHNAMSHTQRRCKSVLITWVSQADRERERHAKPCQQTSTPSDLHYCSAACSLPGQHGAALACPYCVVCCRGLTCLVAPLLWYDNTHWVIHAHFTVCFNVFPQSSDHLLCGSEWKKKRREFPTGTFVSHQSCLKNCCSLLVS